MKAVLICTEYRGVFFGYIDDGDVEKLDMRVKQSRFAIKWGTTKGVAELAHTGPTERSKIGAPADVFLHKVTAVFSVTEEAEKKWIG